MKTTVTREAVLKALDWQPSDPESLTFSKGFFTFRKGYFYTHGKTADQVFVNTVEKLNAAGFTVTDVEFGDKYAPFRGGENVKRNSHWWMKCKIGKIDVSGLAAVVAAA